MKFDFKIKNPFKQNKNVPTQQEKNNLKCDLHSNSFTYYCLLLF